MPVTSRSEPDNAIPPCCQSAGYPGHRPRGPRQQYVRRPPSRSCRTQSECTSPGRYLLHHAGCEASTHVCSDPAVCDSHAAWGTSILAAMQGHGQVELPYRFLSRRQQRDLQRSSGSMDLSTVCDDQGTMHMQVCQRACCTQPQVRAPVWAPWAARGSCSPCAVSSPMLLGECPASLGAGSRRT